MIIDKYSEKFRRDEIMIRNKYEIFRNPERMLFFNNNFTPSEIYFLLLINYNYFSPLNFILLKKKNYLQVF